MLRKILLLTGICLFYGYWWWSYRRQEPWAKTVQKYADEIVFALGLALVVSFVYAIWKYGGGL